MEGYHHALHLLHLDDLGRMWNTTLGREGEALRTPQVKNHALLLENVIPLMGGNNLLPSHNRRPFATTTQAQRLTLTH